MTDREEGGLAALDIIKLLVSLAILVAGIWGFYHFDQAYMTWMRVLGLLVVTGVALLLAATSTQGRRLVSFFTEARAELRKVVWPTRQETVQTTLVVLVVVVVIGIFLSILDLTFSKLVEWFVTPGA